MSLAFVTDATQLDLNTKLQGLGGNPGCVAQGFVLSSHLNCPWWSGGLTVMPEQRPDRVHKLTKEKKSLFLSNLTIVREPKTVFLQIIQQKGKGFLLERGV